MSAGTSFRGMKPSQSEPGIGGDVRAEAERKRRKRREWNGREEEGETPDMNRKDFLPLCVYVCACAPASFSYETRIPWKKDLKMGFFSCSLIAIYILLYYYIIIFCMFCNHSFILHRILHEIERMLSFCTKNERMLSFYMPGADAMR